MAGLWPIDDPTVLVLVKSALGLAAILLVCAGGIGLIRRIRARTDGEKFTSSDILTRFRELHADGRLSDEEFQTIKNRLIEKLHSEINEDEQSD